MKKIFLLLIILFSVSSAFSQYNYNKFNYYTVGLKLGPDFYFYNMDENKNGTFDNNFDYSIGVSGGYYFSWLIEFHGAAYYSNRNFAIDWHYPGIPVGPNDPKVLTRSEYRISYLNFPLEARFNVLYLNWMKLNVGTGIMPDFRFKPRETQYYNNGDIVDSDQYWQTKDFTRLLIAIPFSLNFKFYFERHISMEVSGSYYLYLNRMQEDFLTKPGSAVATRLAVYYEW